MRLCVTVRSLSKSPRPTRTSFITSTIDKVNDIAHSIIERYSRKEIDSVYLVYNEFKSVIAQRVVVEKLLAYP